MTLILLRLQANFYSECLLTSVCFLFHQDQISGCTSLAGISHYICISVQTCILSYYKTQQLKTINIILHALFAKWWFSNEGAMKMLVGLESSEGLTGARGFVCKVTHSHGWQLSGGEWQKHFLTMWPSLQDSLGVLTIWQLAPPRVSNVSQYLISEVT